MRPLRCRQFAWLVLIVALPALARTKPVTPRKWTYPEIVRISYLQGDVRVARGQANEKAHGAPWETAVAGLPLQSGFTLATGNGRAEIELEDASTFYLADHSVLLFKDLHTTAGVPYTEVALLAGTISTHFRPMDPGEVFRIETATDTLTASGRGNHDLRLTAFLNGVELTALDNAPIDLPSMPEQKLSAGKTILLSGDHILQMGAAPDPAQFTAWDRWVAQRIAARDAALASVMKASGLKAPIPGMADMEEQGTFFSCAPYGTCWEPKEPVVQAKASVPQATPQSAQPSPGVPQTSAQTGASPSSPSNRISAATPPQQRPRIREEDVGFACFPVAIRFRIETDPATGRQTTRAMGVDAPWGWAVCHDGNWLWYNHRYVWVAGHHRHHRLPCRWVKIGSTVAFVPRHPRDVPGRLPLNLTHMAFAVSNRNSVELIRADPGERVESLSDPPAEFLKPTFVPLARAAAPQVEIARLAEVRSKSGFADVPAGKLTFDARSGTFLRAHSAARDGKIVTVRSSFAGRSGDLQEHAQGLNSHGSYSMNVQVGSRGGGFFSGFHGGGGGFHGGGGGAHGGGGGFHGGGGGGGGSHGGGGGGGGGSHGH